MKNISVAAPSSALVNLVIYRLNYLKGNLQQFMLVRFNEELKLFEMVERAKKFCAHNNMRFVFIEPAITTIDEKIEEEIL